VKDTNQQKCDENNRQFSHDASLRQPASCQRFCHVAYTRLPKEVIEPPWGYRLMLLTKRHVTSPAATTLYMERYWSISGHVIRKYLSYLHRVRKKSRWTYFYNFWHTLFRWCVILRNLKLIFDYLSLMFFSRPSSGLLLVHYMVPFSPFPFMFLFVFVLYHVTVWMGSNKLNWTELKFAYHYCTYVIHLVIQLVWQHQIRRRICDQNDLADMA